jgi:hypothetical protein
MNKRQELEAARNMEPDCDYGAVGAGRYTRVNNEKFKEFIAPLFDKAIGLLDGIRSVQLMFETLPEQTIYFVAGVIHGLAFADPQQRRAIWRDEATSILYNFSHEEKRRVLDYVRLRIETRSGTS